MNKQTKHLLRIYELGSIRTIRLHQDHYLIGRDKHNDIVLFSKTVSRCHAHITRIPTSYPTDICYRIIDGDMSGKPSTNGLTVNNQNCKIHDLSNGDSVIIGKVKISYCIQQVASLPLNQFSEMMNFQQVEEPTLSYNPKSTLAEKVIPEVSSPANINNGQQDDLPATTLFQR